MFLRIVRLFSAGDERLFESLLVSASHFDYILQDECD